ncbi:nitroreductase family protein [Pontibacter chinhatensis]|uniref:Nitroreductase n=1 Tax=Pontibacter chinhatensis TaxID=1436961 RepID=A0A1I2QXP2_9BACT|nr:nitroreductase family protein [Pontibacter chinhatensis]SFG33235.1 Nitroreductase [Pontibacter chinhatensis]
MIKKLIRRIQAYKVRAIEDYLPRLCYKSRLLSNLYYILNSKFSREHQAVLAGRVKHIKEAKETKANYYLLVRNTHRIEKGLLMKPRRAVFGKEYITETIDSFEGVWSVSKKDKSNSQIKWFYDVLSEYFGTSGEDELIKHNHKRFEKIINGAHTNFCTSTEVKSIPYYRNTMNKVSIDFESFFKLTKYRRSVRWFLDERVPRELIDKAILAANQSPSACNRQPFEFRIFDDPELVKRVVKIPMGTKGYGQSIPVMIVVVGNLDAYFDERDRHIIYIDASLACMSFMLALETLGLGSCPINWPDIETKEIEMEKLLNLKKHQRPIMCIGLGYPDPEGMVAFSEKRPLDQIRQYN